MIQVFSTPTCPWCHKVKDFLKEKGVKFEDHNVAADLEKRKEMMDKSGQLGVPVLEIDGTIVIGFDQEKIEHLLGEHKDG